jgi:hypothetical protein
MEKLDEGYSTEKALDMIINDTIIDSFIKDNTRDLIREYFNDF